MIYNSIKNLIEYGIKKELITSEDTYVVKNQLMEILKLSDWVEPDEENFTDNVEEILGEMVDYACENKIIENTTNNRDLFDTKIMGALTPMPREVSAKFSALYQQNPALATDWYYDFSKNLNYVRAGRIAKDMKWTYDSEYGTLDITINRSKPEKDPRDIAKAGKTKSASYPKCQLCPENAGFSGHISHPARQNLRPVPMTVGGQPWQLQYSPYGYYNEHCIVFNTMHIPMKIDFDVFGKLFDIVEYLPHYFVGSNADLPIVGGSILSHEHFQGGNYTFAMAKAKVEKEFSLEKFPQVKAGIVKWPMSVVRVESDNREELAKCCDHILKKWRNYTDESVHVFAYTDGVPHNTITPIVRKVGEKYQCDLVLRNNITTEKCPLGLFHPNPTLHHIKKENIGLIEVMGLAVLPARLATELVELKDAMLLGKDISNDEKLSQHKVWADEILKKHPEFNEQNASDILRMEVGRVFLQVLKDAGVFKRDEIGQKAFEKFIDTL